VKLVLATANRGKVRELGQALAALGIDVVGLEDVGLRQAPENGATFAENAHLKALAAVQGSGMSALAEDSGLEVDALGGRPGVHSARFAGEDATDEQNNGLLLESLRGLSGEQRGAQFRCVMVLAHPDGRRIETKGICRGHIASEPRGRGGFGYDTLFVPDGERRTFAQMTVEEKARFSHRAKALTAMIEKLQLDIVPRLPYHE